MKVSKKVEAEVIQVYESWLHSYINGDVRTYDSYLDDSYHFIGSTGNEEFLNKEDTTAFFEATASQLAGKTQIRNNRRSIESIGATVFITDLFDGWFLNGSEWNFYGRFRFTSALHQTKNGWRFIYQHFSTPDAKAQEGETIGYEKVSAENLQLREAIKRRTIELEQKNRELQIEAAVERVRATALAMNQSEDIHEVVRTLRTELLGLELSGVTGGSICLKQDDGRVRYFDITDVDQSGRYITDITFDISETDPGLYLRKIWNSRKKIVAAQQDADDLKTTLNWIAQYDKKTANEIRQLLQENNITHGWHRAVKLDHGRLIIDFLNEPPAETDSILLKIGAAFDLAYKRFLDLKNAEAQAREAQIEVALERVRARTMAMQHSDELMETSELMFEQIKNLGIKLWSCGFSLWYDDDSYFLGYNPGPNGKLGNPLRIPLTEDIFFTTIREAKRRGDDFLVFESGGESLVETYRYMDNLPVVGETMRGFVEAGFPLPKFQVTHCGFFSNGHLMFILQEHNYEAVDIFKRFTKVFNQTYTRFLDLQKAEAQAREAQVEVAVERVRAQSMAMHHPDDLDKVNKEILTQLKWLQIQGLSGVTFYLVDKNGWVKAWDFSSPGNIGDQTRYNLQFDFNRYEMLGFPFKILLQTDLDYFIADYPIEKLEKAVYEFEEIDPAVAGVLKEALSSGSLTHQWSACVRISNGMLGIDLVNPPDEDTKSIVLKMAGAFNQAYTRFLDLQKAESQAREAQIEAALEKVRSRTMAMQKSDELGAVASVLFQEMNRLVSNLWTCGFVLCEKDRPEDEWWLSMDTGFTRGFFLPNVGDYAHATLYEGWLNGESSRAVQLEGELLEEHYRWLMTIEISRKIFEEMDAAGLERPEWQKLHAAYFSRGYLVMITREPCIDQAIFTRFAQVFDLTYTRFLDLKKAEAQAREAKIEMALEKIRSRTMAMQHSDELPEAALLMFQEIRALGVPAWSCGYNVLAEDKKTSDCWMSSEGAIQAPFTLYFTEESSFIEWYQFLLSGESFYVQELGGKELEDHYNYMRNIPQLGEVIRKLEDAGITLPTYQINHLCKYSFGFLLFITYEPVPEAHDIFKRFTKVFEQTYTRFNDLKQKEAQAREAQIEAALEKVRAKVMSMNNSSEMNETSLVFGEQLRKLGIDWQFSYFWLIEEEQDKHTFWITWPDNKSSTTTYSQAEADISFKECIVAWKQQAKIHATHVPIQDVQAWLDTFERISIQAGGVAVKIMRADNFKEGVYYYDAMIKFGSFGILMNRTINDEEQNIQSRFAKEFERAYTRFIDLQKAEMQAREAEIELALERVRSQAMAMSKSSDLLDIVVTMRNEFTRLGHEAHYFWHMMWLPDKYEKAMTSGDGSKIGMVMELPRHIHGDIELLSRWEKSDEPLVVYPMDVDAALDYVDKMVMLGNFKQVDPHAPSHDDIRHINGLTFVMARTTHGEIGYSLPGVVTDPPAEDLNILVRFAGAFDIAHRRFLDLQQSEAQALQIRQEKERLEITLANLKATQSQLIQSEKMASLGELTAGIAHEIQNPLNFVNNFSEVNLELIEEVKSEKAKVKVDGTDDEQDELLNDIEENLKKISFHGKRADAIVKSMLQHSRQTTGIKEPTDINALVDEYLRLSYHGLRAKDKSFNCLMETHFDPAVGKVEVMGQDIGRVLLNLFNNAFYAINEKKRHAGEDYEPVLQVTTTKNRTGVEIKVKDNGSGIPETVLEKIYQPFFTTKPTGEGTGLGLSLSYDIITKGHGGEMTVETQEGKGSEFVVHLPIV